MIFGLVLSALGSVAMGFVTSLPAFYALAVVVGFLGEIAGPAHGAMVANMLPEEQRSEGYGILRIVGNLAWIIGPTIGGLLALHSYMLLFITDAITSLITAAIVYRLIPETKPVPARARTGRIAAPDCGRIPRGGARSALHGVPGNLYADAGCLSADVQYPFGLSA